MPSFTVSRAHPATMETAQQHLPPTVAHGAAGTVRWRDYYELCKPRVVAMIVFTAIIGMLLASPGLVALPTFLAATIGIGLAAASAAAINHVADHRIDALMERTRHRPLPGGHLARGRALAFALVLGVASMAILVAYINVLTAVLTFATLIGYAVIYTTYLKRATPQNIVIGGAAGAAPEKRDSCAEAVPVFRKPATVRVASSFRATVLLTLRLRRLRRSSAISPARE